MKQERDSESDLQKQKVENLPPLHGRRAVLLVRMRVMRRQFSKQGQAAGKNALGFGVLQCTLESQVMGASGGQIRENKVHDSAQEHCFKGGQRVLQFPAGGELFRPTCCQQKLPLQQSKSASSCRRRNSGSPITL